jgi:hypothetical protein
MSAEQQPAPITEPVLYAAEIVDRPRLGARYIAVTEWKVVKITPKQVRAHRRADDGASWRKPYTETRERLPGLADSDPVARGSAYTPVLYRSARAALAALRSSLENAVEQHEQRAARAREDARAAADLIRDLDLAE